ncbi:MAG: PilN family type IVB pilus formation outer membrane protein, partial [Polaromonas sp.]|nr:PilN family type IVB pilus formation outer membrane protein [Polaromonas sp.]
MTVKVRVLSVELNEGDNFGVNWDAVYSNLASASIPYSLAMLTAYPFAAGGGNMILSAPSS